MSGRKSISKSYRDHRVASRSSDPSTIMWASPKKYLGRTVCTDEERYEALRHCRYVDIILPSAPWGYSEEFFDEHKIDFIAHDDEPYTIGGGGVSGKLMLSWSKC